MAAKLLDRTLLERVGDKAAETCGLSASISWLSHLVHSGQAPGQGASQSELEAERLSTVSQSAFILRFPPSNKLVNAWACTRYKKYPSGIMIVPSGAIIILS